MEERIELLERLVIETVDALKREQELMARVIDVQKMILKILTSGVQNVH